MTDREKADKLLKMVRAFVKKHEISCEESVMQRDDPQIESPELVANLCAVAGFYYEE